MSRFALIKAVLGPIMRLMFRPQVEGAEHIPGDGPVILAGNHLTFIDSMILPLVCDRQVFFIGKDEYVTGKGLKGRLMAWFFTGVGMIQAGEDPRFIARRLMISASEDIGLADPNALQIA
ncbi:1-acyl-sn-glycerol-3-phosphate acyltransferase, partial [Streptomyces cellulosae]